MRKIFLILFVLVSSATSGQKISNLVLVGPEGVTEDASKATSFIVVKEFPDSSFERLDYKKGGPMSMLRTYKDSDLRILDGRYLKYASNGAIEVLGHYLNGQKVGNWLTFNDSGKVITTIRYDHDTIVIDRNPKPKDTAISFPDEKDASFPGGPRAWQKYLVKSLEKSKTAEKAFTGGTVYINFVIGVQGDVQDIFVSKSVEFVIDDESVEIIKKSPKWNPAFQNGRNVKAYRRQPLTFVTPG
jgi:protein TonB